MTDPISDMLSRIRNGVSAKHARVDLPGTKGRAARQMIRLFLKYGPHGEKVISGLERISRPGRRVYLGVDDVPTVLGGLGTSILTTSRGVMTGRAAKKAGVGGEVLCNVW